MKLKCSACKGKGGFSPSGRKVILGIWITCTQCKGRGVWYNNEKPKISKNTTRNMK